ncbi:MAG: Gfo/Idh/MocA family oxidoreductase [Candidatus Lokiarchaeota archaeon]|nr:Gfo/Idh/MocA family oxidoreductase [Candidatus Lokiarchaeota archaeon]
MSNKKQTAVIGAGSFGKAHARNYNDISDLIAICDSNMESAKNAALAYEDVRVYNDVDKMLKEEKIDAISIVTPPSVIPALTEKCAQKGINVLMEKPMGLKYADVEALTAYNSVRIHPGFIELYNPVVDEAKQYLSRIGNILTISSKRIGLFPRRYWGMGVVLDLTVHDVYLQRDFLGDIQSVKSMVRYFHDSQFEDAAYVLLDFGDAKGLIESNWLTPTKYRKMFISGENGTIEVDFIRQYLTFLEGKDLTKAKPEIWETKINYLRPKEPLREELMDFLYSDIPKVTLENHGLKALKVVLDVLKEAKKK